MLPRIALDRINVHLGGRHVLHDISWSLEPGRHWAIMGPNGSGKSTLLRVLAGTQWIDADGGTRTFSPDGVRQDVAARAATWIRQVSGEQHERYARLDLPLSGRAIVESGFDNSVYVHRAPEAAQARRVDALLEHFELEPFAGRPVRELSSGQVRRLLIARALAGEPRVILLDEFTNGLDRAARAEVLAFLERLAGDVGLVVASHRIDDFPSAVNHTAVMSGGRISEVVPNRPRRDRRAEPPRFAAREPDGDPDLLLRIRHADVYRGASRVLEDIDWDLHRGEHTLIGGANGAGKSTFAGLVAGTISAATGADIVRFGEREPFDVWKLKEQIAHVSDDLQIAYDQTETVEAVVASGFTFSIGLFAQPPPAEREAVAALLARIGLEPLRNRLFTRLSFGERRKVLIARSLVRRPAIYVLDEVWNGLDAEFRHAFSALLREMAELGTTIVAVAHDADEELAFLAWRVCRIEAGKIHHLSSAFRP